LFRPVGLHELKLILEADYREFPARLTDQPIFYPVLNREYAIEIARDWNTKDATSGYCGFVTEFEVEDAFIDKYETHDVGATRHQELWVPANELSGFNRKIIGNIKIVNSFYGKSYIGEIDKVTSLPIYT